MITLGPTTHIVMYYAKDQNECPLCNAHVDGWASATIALRVPTVFCLPCGHRPFAVPGQEYELSPELRALLILRMGDY